MYDTIVGQPARQAEAGNRYNMDLHCAARKMIHTFHDFILHTCLLHFGPWLRTKTVTEKGEKMSSGGNKDTEWAWLFSNVLSGTGWQGTINRITVNVLQSVMSLWLA